MMGVLDETTPEVGGGILYTVVSGLIIRDEEEARTELSHIVSGRQRGFHWMTEGPVARSAMVSCLTAIDVVGSAVVAECGRRGQEAARERALRASVEELLGSGCSRLIIESRSSRQDDRDRGVILDLLRGMPDTVALKYEWQSKEEPLLWVPDAIGGVVREYLLGEPSPWFDKIQAATGLALTYL